MFTAKTRFCVLVFALIAGTSLKAYSAATITIQNGDPAGVGFNDATAAAPVGGNNGTTLGQQRLNAFQAAADKWGATLSSNVTIRILATWEALTCTSTTAVLGSAGATSIFRDFPGAPFPGTWFSKALTNKLTGTDQDSTTADIKARFNINLGNPGCLDGSPFYLGLDNNHGAKVDLVAVLTHEFAHGLGFQTFTSSSTGAQTSGFPSVYDRFLLDLSTGKLWFQMTDAERAASAVNTQKLAWNGPQVATDVPKVLGNPSLKITSPAAIAGTYTVGTASFGPALTVAGISGAVVQALDPADGSGPSTTDGCSSLTNAFAVAGKIALVDRGTCAFVAKAANAQAAGAIGLIVVNNVAGSPPPGLGGSDPTITIPVVSVIQSDGTTIKAQLGSGVNATVGLDPTVRPGADSMGRALMFTPNPLQGGSSVSHWDSTAFPNQLMEPNISSDLTHQVTQPNDLTFSLLSDIGWAPSSATPADLTITKSHSGNFLQGQTGAAYAISVGNIGGPTSGSVSVTDTLPTGLTATAIAGAGWSCDLPTLSCNRVDVLPNGASYPPIAVTVNVAGNAPANVTNQAVVSGGGDNNSSNNSASDSTTVSVTQNAVSQLQFSSSTFTGSETASTAVITVNRTGDTSGSSTVDYLTSDGTALQISDYEIASGTLTFAPGDTQKTITVLINQDHFVESSETFTVTLSNPINGSLGGQTTAAVSITDDDSAAKTPVPRLFVSDVSKLQVTPATNSTARAAGIVQLSPDEATASVSLTITSALNSTEVSAGIFGPAAAGANGPLAFALPLGSFKDTQLLLTAAQATQFKSGQFYISIQTQNSPNGEIRGQLLANPMDDAQQFVQQQYYDFLARVPDAGGLGFWTAQITGAGTDPIQLRNKRVDVSNAFFYELEYQQTGAYVFRLYRAAYGNNQPFPNPDASNPTESNKLPSYLVFSRDRARVIGGANLTQGQLDLANQFILRPEFIAKYSSSLDGPSFVDAILLNIKNNTAVDLTGQRAGLIALFNSGGRGAVIYRLADDNTTTNPINNRAFIDEEYNRAFVATQYFGYMRRDADIGGFLFWLDQVNRAPLRDVPRQHAMVCSFITSGEYQLRFSSVISRFNSECPQ
jgi:uncharacterized repeat protein (TIGR01451 family)